MPSWCKHAINEWIGMGNADEYGPDVFAWQQPHHVFRPVDKAGHIGNGNSMSPQSIFMIVKRLAEQAGLGSISPHDLRRTFAKLAHKGRAQLEQIQLSLGHASIQTTERYLGVEQDLTDAPCDHLGISLKA
jgi:integrase